MVVTTTVCMSTQCWNKRRWSGGTRKSGGRGGGVVAMEVERWQVDYRCSNRCLSLTSPTPELGTLWEGPFKASSKNIHTVEVSSSEATNTFEPTFWPFNPYDRKPKQVYVYETVEETSWD
ncbi:hypothetical protein Pmani_001244 [Petrolisthes manimaculis]|uniref:Uncharacterized protein n=1 Tax=Petrolisthes manimaculis TaxID=1843537 RepID=A0AAE1QNG9_9EUCA|nr:hypothetical protein Pmani_001244 [Petrolisthes manimaculis]